MFDYYHLMDFLREGRTASDACTVGPLLAEASSWRITGWHRRWMKFKIASRMVGLLGEGIPRVDNTLTLPSEAISLVSIIDDFNSG